MATLFSSLLDNLAANGGVLLLSTAVLLLAAAAATGDTPHAKVSPVPFDQVTLEDEFWAPKMERNAQVSLPHQIRMCEETGRLRNFAIAGGLEEGEFEGIYFNDSDVYKILEGAAYAYQTTREPSIKAEMDRIVDLIAAAQGEDGYINTYYTLVEPDNRWTNLPTMHELYCAGHLIEAAVAHHRATGERKLLDVAIRFADLIDSRFGEEEGQEYGVPGHEEIELALVKLAEATGEQRYLDLAQYFIDAKGRSGQDYYQDQLPVRQHETIHGHAVRGMYLYAGVADIVARTGDEDLAKAIRSVWHDTVERKMYVTGGVGPSAHNEGFTTPYDLPNDTAYAETCASIGMVLWGSRMLSLFGDAGYADVIERVLYNGFLSGWSLSGDRFFYVNPLESQGNHHRQPWFGCACCPPNVLRLIAQIGGFFYGASEDALWIHLYGSSTATTEVAGTGVRVIQRTDYPWDGTVRIAVTPDEAGAEFALKLRVPWWCEQATCTVNDEAVEAAPGSDGYLTIARAWSEGDQVELTLPMQVRRVLAHPAVAANRGRVALQRGPVLYCLEAVDNGADIRKVYLPRTAALQAVERPDLLGGVVTLQGEALVSVDALDRDELYRFGIQPEAVAITAVPYHVWDNREPGPMAVWLPESAGLIEPDLAPTPADSARVSASYVHASLSAVNDRRMPKASSERGGRNFDWWDHKGTTEWIAYEWDQPVAVSGVEVYWFDDTGVGQCKAPESWRIEYLEGEEWREVTGSPRYETRLNDFNRATFEPVTTRGLRLVVKLQDEWSAGICEWRVLGE